MIGWILVAAAHALPWWAATPEEGEAVRAALADLWPTGPFVVSYGAHVGPGAWYEDGVLHLVLRDGERAGAAPADADEQVVLARAWLREMAPTRKARMGPPQAHVAILGGTGLARDVAPAPAHLATEGGWTWGPVSLVPFATADIGAVFPTDEGRAIYETRAGLGVAAGLRAPLWGGELAVLAGPTVRGIVARYQGDTVGVVLPGVAERVHWWRAIAPAWDFGAGAVVQFDGPGSSWADPSARVGGAYYHRPEMTAALELGVAVRP